MLISTSAPGILFNPVDLQQQLQQLQAQALNLNTIPPATRTMLTNTASALVAIATALSTLAFMIVLFRLMANAHKPQLLQHDMALLGESAFVLVLLFGITTVIGIFATVYLRFG